jgi:hypothetical protein
LWVALWTSVLIGMLPGATFAQIAASPSDATAAKSEEEPLWEAVVDPTAILAQVRFFDFYTPGNFQTSAQTNIFLLQPIVPVAPLSLLPAEQLIRFTFKVSTLATGPGSHPITALADTQLYDLFQGKWSYIERWKLRWAIGAIVVFPTATDHRAGASAWQTGPAAGISFAGVPNLWVGLLAQNPISFAYTRSGATPQNVMFFQPGLSYRLGQGWYVKSTDSVWNVNWRHHTPTTVPVSLGFGRVWKFRGQTLDTWTSGEWMAYRQFAGITPMYTVRFGLNFVFPEFVLGH